MGYNCDFCGEQRSIVYCRSDSASLCLSCDRNIHSANLLSRRHSRTLQCERCNAQPAFVRCVEERISLCQNCDWTGHNNTNTSTNTNLVHKKQTVNCYSGCPSAAELSEIWSFLLDFPSSCEQETGSMSLTDDKPRNCPEKNEDMHEEKSRILMDSSRGDFLDPKKLCNSDNQAGSSSSAMLKIFLSGAKGPDDGFFDDFNLDEVDIENYEEIFGNDPEQLFDYELYGTKDMSRSNGQEASGIEWMNVPAYSNAASADSVKTEPNLHFSRQTNSNVSISGLIGESSARDYQDCGASSIRRDAVSRYKEKKKARKKQQKILYGFPSAFTDTV